MRMATYRWVYANGVYNGKTTYLGERFYQVGILPDGTLYNPNGYDEASVRAAVEAADAYLHERRARAAKQAAVTRRARVEARVYAVVKRWQELGALPGPRPNCYCCGRGLDDPQSIQRGIGSECWGRVLAQLEAKAVVAHHADTTA
jgi:Family of unknown function (DUF6011)